MEKKDLVIIGSGPAGLSAAVYAQRAMLEQVVIEKESYSGGQIVVTDKVDNYLGLPGEGGYELSVRFREHADKLKVPFLEGEVVKITDQKDFKEVHMENGDIIRAKAVIIAAGASHKKLEVSGVFVAIGMKPQSEFVKDIVDIDDSGACNIKRLNGQTGWHPSLIFRVSHLKGPLAGFLFCSVHQATETGG